MAATSVAAAGGSFAFACLPDLEFGPPLPPPVTAAPTCGDGVIGLGEVCDPGDAGDPGCSPSCEIACSGQVDPETHHCYFVPPSQTAPTYEAAVYACGFESAHVVTFASSRERQVVHDYVQTARPSGTPSTFWVGLSPGASGYQSAKPGEPGWRAGCPGCFAAVPPDASDVPLASLDAGGGCVSDAPGAGTYLGVPCEKSERLVMCEREPPGSALELRAGGFSIGWNDAGALRKRWFYVPVAVRADEAREACSALGWRLAIFDSAEEREAVISQIQTIARPGDEAVWLGLASDGGTFEWDDGVSPRERPQPWGFGQPPEGGAPARAAALLPPGAVDVQLARATALDQRRAYLCEIK